MGSCCLLGREVQFCKFSVLPDEKSTAVGRWSWPQQSANALTAAELDAIFTEDGKFRVMYTSQFLKVEKKKLASHIEKRVDFGDVPID